MLINYFFLNQKFENSLTLFFGSKMPLRQSKTLKPQTLNFLYISPGVGPADHTLVLGVVRPVNVRIRARHFYLLFAL